MPRKGQKHTQAAKDKISATKTGVKRGPQDEAWRKAISVANKGRPRTQQWKDRISTAKTKPLEERFWSKVDIRRPDDCWPWKARCNKKGYGQFKITIGRVTKSHGAHRVAFFLTHGHWPKPQCRHTCDNPPCCNPAHLLEGTQLDNWRDVFEHRAARNKMLT